VSIADEIKDIERELVVIEGDMNNVSIKDNQLRIRLIRIELELFKIIKKQAQI